MRTWGGFEVSSRDLPYFIIFITWALVIASFVIVRKRIERESCSAHPSVQMMSRVRNTISLLAHARNPMVYAEPSSGEAAFRGRDDGAGPARTTKRAREPAFTPIVLQNSD